MELLRPRQRARAKPRVHDQDAGIDLSHAQDQLVPLTYPAWISRAEP